jgi:hypothetical protein
LDGWLAHPASRREHLNLSLCHRNYRLTATHFFQLRFPTLYAFGIIDIDRMVVMASGSGADRFMVDPSVLLTDEAIQALYDEGVPSGSVVSASFYDALSEGPDELFLPFMTIPDQQLLRRARDELRSQLEVAEKYSYRLVESLPNELDAIRGSLLERESVAGPVLADEFAYLATAVLAGVESSQSRRCA